MNKKDVLRELKSIALPVAIITSFSALIINILTGIYKADLNMLFGEGVKHVEKIEGSESWDTNYYDKIYDTNEASKKAAYATSKKISDEGIILLKNKDNTLPLNKDTIISPFGYGYQNPRYFGVGSGRSDYKEFITPENGLKKNFSINEEVSKISKDPNNVMEIENAPGTSNHESNGVDSLIKVIDPFKYSGLELLSNGTTGVVFITRTFHENIDAKFDPYVDGTKHSLSLTIKEKETINFAKKHCDKVILVLNVPTTFELDEVVDQNSKYECDSVLWMGYAGASGFESLSDILAGKINPSGRTFDTFVSNMFKTPSFANFGDFKYKFNTNGTFLEYEEGIYVGYKYYETYDTLFKNSSIFGFDYDEEVTFPFGYGLSYTKFSQDLISLAKKDNNLLLEVEVVNNGNVSGKDTVQLYYEAPYDDIDKELKIEKASKNLIKFQKTKLLKPGEKEIMNFIIPLDQLASYSYNHNNPDGSNGAYFLEKGEYKIYLGKNSHESYESKSYLNPHNIWYDSLENIRPYDKFGQSDINQDGEVILKDNNFKREDGSNFYTYVNNEFDILNEYMSQSNITNLTRSNWLSTQPTAPENKDFRIDMKYENFYKSLINFDNVNHPILGNNLGTEVYDDTPVLYEPNDLTLSSLRGKNYDDESWETLLKNINFDNEQTLNELRDLIIFGGYRTNGFSPINKPETVDYDGTSGFNNPLNSRDNRFLCYPNQTVLAATWNLELANEMGHSIGKEALTNNINGWYAPGLNIHRNVFGGRNFEYYSEDPYLTGMMGLEVTNGAGDEGLTVYIKHFVLNEQEYNRSNVKTWVNEQALRETYLKPFEIVTKESRRKLKYTANTNGEKKEKIIKGNVALMTSFNCIGPYPTAGCKPLLTDILRDERGFDGMVISDYQVDVDFEVMIRSGNDIYLWPNVQIESKKPFREYIKDVTSLTSKNALKRAIKNISYATVNGNAFNGIAPGYVTYQDEPLWKVLINYALNGTLLTITGISLSYYLAYYVIKYIKKKQNK